MMRQVVCVFLSLLVGGLSEALEEKVGPAAATLAAVNGSGSILGKLPTVNGSAVLDNAYAVGDSLPDQGANLTSVFGLMAELIEKELRSGSKVNQLVTGGVSLVLGAVMLWDGLHVFEIFILILSFVVVYLLSMGNFQTSEYTAHFGSGAQIWEKILSLEVAVLISFTFKFSIGLVKKFLGLAIGIFAFLWLQSFLVDLAAQHQWQELGSIATSPYYFMASALVCFPTGVWLFADGPSYVFAILAPIFGSIMFASSVFFFATFFDHNKCVECPPKHDWIDFVAFLLNTGKAADVGPLHGQQLGVPINRWAITSFTLVTCAFSMYRQVSIAKEEKMQHAGTLCDKLLGIFCHRNHGDQYQPLLQNKEDKIRELEQQLRSAKASR